MSGDGTLEAIVLERKSREMRVRTMIGLQGRVCAAVRYVCDLIRQGAIGLPPSNFDG